MEFNVDVRVMMLFLSECITVISTAPSAVCMYIHVLGCMHPTGFLGDDDNGDI